jgi:uncharacterized protein
MKQIFKKLILDFHKQGLPKFINRNLSIPLNSGKIITLIGPRRSGKTYISFQIMSSIKDITDILYMSFENEKFKINADNFQELIDAYFELYPNKENFYLFLDEIQEIDGWEKFVRRIYDTFTKNIFITGSSAKLLSKEIATSLRGRCISYEIYPLSFKEFLKFKNIELDSISTRGKANIIKSFNEYIDIGGFPECFFMNNDLRKRTIKDYMHVMIFRDVIERYSLRNSNAVHAYFKRNISNFAREYSINKFYNELKSMGVKITKDSLYEFNRYFDEAFIILPLFNYYQNSFKNEINKFYLIDHSFSVVDTFKLSENKGLIIENIVFIELKRREKDVFYYKALIECDFVIKEKEKIVEAIQVCYILNKENKDREIKGLLEAMNKHKLKQGLLLTYDDEEEIIIDKKKIIIKPVWLWLLEN